MDRITSVGEERANFSAFVYLSFCGFSSSWYLVRQGVASWRQRFVLKNMQLSNSAEIEEKLLKKQIDD